MVVWVSSWQMECCGDPFAVGDRVEWTAEETDDEWFAAALGPEMAGRITHSEEHHDDGREGLLHISGVVVSIAQAWCAYGPQGPDSRVRYPITGTAKFVDVRDDTIPDGRAFPDLHFNGWVVELEPDI